MLSSLGLLRLVSLVGVLVWYSAFAHLPRLWRVSVFSVAFCHYALAVYYGRRRIATSAASPQAWTRAFAMLLLGVGLYFQSFPLIIYFGIHHVFTEAYMRPRFTGPAPVAGGWAYDLWGPAAVTFHAFLYGFIVRSEAPLDAIPRAVWLWGLAVSGAAFVGVAIARGRGRSFAALLDDHASELVGLALAFVSLRHPVTLVFMVAYHIALWAVQPVAALAARGARPVGTYLALQVGLSLAAFLLSPLGPGHHLIGKGVFNATFFFMSFFHITASFFWSDTQPSWITRFFKGAAPPSPAAVPASG